MKKTVPLFGGIISFQATVIHQIFIEHLSVASTALGTVDQSVSMECIT